MVTASTLPTHPGKPLNLTGCPAPSKSNTMASNDEFTMSDAEIATMFAPFEAAMAADGCAGFGAIKKSHPEVKMAASNPPASSVLVVYEHAAVGAAAVPAPAPAAAPATISDRDERYDEEILLAMRKDVAMNPADRAMLSKYHGLRREPGKARIRYTLSKNCEDHNLGRLIPEHGLGLQGMRWDCRNALAHKYYWDIDIENAHYNYALAWAVRYGLKHEAIQYYISHRKACLAAVSADRWFAKVAFIKIMYGGEVSLYDPLLSEPDGSSNAESISFQAALRDEMVVLAEMVWNRHPTLHKVKSGKESKPLDKQHNKHFKLLSLLFQREERSCLLSLDAFLRSRGRTMGVLIHDGGLVEKLDGELEPPTALLAPAQEAILAATGYVVTLAFKPMVSTYVPPTTSADQYTRMKADFDSKHFMVGAVLNCLVEDNTRLEMKWSEACIHYAPLQVTDLVENKKGDLMPKQVPFLDKWLKDPTRPTFIKCDFIPDRTKCPKSVFNLFHGFEAEALPSVPADEIPALIAPILHHLDTLTTGHGSHMVKWMANILQSPDNKSDTTVLLRDQGGLLHEGGGTGKNLLLDWFGRKILGSDYYLVVGDNSMLFSQFNSIFEGKLLVFVEEAGGKDNHAFIDRLQSKITAKRVISNKKCVAEREMNDFARFLFSTNNANPLPSKGGMSRRQWMFDSLTTYRGNKAYFDALVAVMDDPRVQRAFFQFLMAVPTYATPIEFFVNRPITPTYIQIRQMNAPLHHKWLCYELRRGRLPQDCSSRRLYDRFKLWALSSGERKAETLPSETAFGRFMNEAYAEEDGFTMDAPCVVRKSGGLMLRTFDIPKLIKGLETLNFLMPGEVALTAEGEFAVVATAEAGDVD